MHAPRLALHGTTGLILLNTQALCFEARWGEQFVGIAGLLECPDDCPEIYCTIFKCFRRRNFASDATDMLCRWVFDSLGHPRVRSSANKDNKGPHIFLPKLGFTVCKVDAAIIHYERLRPPRGARE